MNERLDRCKLDEREIRERMYGAPAAARRGAHVWSSIAEGAAE